MFEVTADMFLAGGNAVILYAAKYSDVRAVINISGRFDLERGMEGRLGKDFRQRIKRDGFIDVKNRRGKLSYAVILIFHKHSCLIIVVLSTVWNLQVLRLQTHLSI